jgi:ribosome-associated heat shock protein Hsp15
MRIDKWLWAARFFKTRALAVKACDLNRIECNGLKAKPSRDLHVGDTLHIKNEAAEYDVEVLTLSEVRGPAATAQTLYSETPASVQKRALAEAQRKELHAQGATPTHRPSKQDRRQINHLRGR